MPRATGRPTAARKAVKAPATKTTTRKVMPTKKQAPKKAAPAKKASAVKSAVKKAPAKKKAAPAAKKAAPAVKKKAPAAKKTAPAKKAPAKKAAPVKQPAKQPAPAAKKAAPPPPAKKAVAPVKVPAPIKNLGPIINPVMAPKKINTRKGPVVLDKFLLGQKAALEEERATYTHQAETLQAEADQIAAEREPGDVQFDEESGEGDTLAVERERDLALSFQARAAVDEIDAALAKIAEGSYGTCEQCGNNIPKERLRAIPYAALCVTCKSMGLGRR